MGVRGLSEDRTTRKANTGLKNIPLPHRFIEGKDNNQPAGLMGTAIYSTVDDDKNGLYYLFGDLDQSPEVWTKVDTLIIGKQGDDNLIRVYKDLRTAMWAERYRYCYAFQPFVENGKFFVPIDILDIGANAEKVDTI